MDHLPSTVPTLTLAHSRVPEPPSLTAAWLPVDPATRTGCAWYVVAPRDPATPGSASHAA